MCVCVHHILLFPWQLAIELRVYEAAGGRRAKSVGGVARRGAAQWSVTSGSPEEGLATLYYCTPPSPCVSSSHPSLTYTEVTPLHLSLPLSQSPPAPAHVNAPRN